MNHIPVSNGELIDKYTILLIKQEFIKDSNKLKKVEDEINVLKSFVKELIHKYDIQELMNNLKNINKELWNIEDNIRLKEKAQLFDKEFIELARSVYFTNDKRAEIKNIINEKTNSSIFEVKSYEKYD